MSTQWGHDPYGSGQDPYGAGNDPYGSSSSDGAPHETGHSSSFPQHGGPQFGTGAQGPYAYPVAMAPPSSGLGIAGFILGILSLTFCSGITGPFGLVLSIMGMKETAPGATPPKSGRGLAIAGLVLSILGTLVLLALVAYIVFMVVLVGATAGSQH